MKSILIFILIYCYVPFIKNDTYSSKGLLVGISKEASSPYVTVLNKDNSVYAKIPLLADTPPKGLPQDLDPLIIDIPNNHLIFEVLDEEPERYKVVIGKDKSKYIMKSEKFIKYYTWEDFILKYDYSSLIISKTTNPLKIAPTLNSKTLSYVDYESDSFSGKQVKGDWLKVEVVDIYDASKKPRYGWVRWKDKNKIIIDFRFYD